MPCATHIRERPDKLFWDLPLETDEVLISSAAPNKHAAGEAITALIELEDAAIVENVAT